ncbi:MAG: hypothetical protein HC924_06625 [Synechococcaceae cyanobacterium SM2_3_2]|nr:hypothetical protein [Synechococcaceae cyanobacterium SM2_3_2]
MPSPPGIPYPKSQLSILIMAGNITVMITGAEAQLKEPEAYRFWRPVDRLVMALT